MTANVTDTAAITGAKSDQIANDGVVAVPDVAAVGLIQCVDGDLLSVEADFIVQQCNCLTVRAHGLSDSIARALGVDPYATRRAVGRRNLAIEADRSVPGTIQVAGRVVNLFGQWRPGAIGTPYFDSYPESPDGRETAALRLQWFRAGLAALKRRIDCAQCAVTVAFPFQIGCGLAKGKWSDYEAAIASFAASLPNATVLIVRQRA